MVHLETQPPGLMAACADAVHAAACAIDEQGTFGDLSLRLANYSPYLCKEQFLRLGIDSPDQVIRVLARVPEIALKWCIAFVVNTSTHLRHMSDAPFEIDSNVEDLVSGIAGSVIAAAKHCQTERQAIKHVHFGIKSWLEWLDLWVHVNLDLDALACDKVEGERWVWDGFHEQAIEGQQEILTEVPEWEWCNGLLIRGLTGEQRHKLIMYVIDCRQSGNTPDDLLERVVYYGTYDPIDRDRLYWETDHRRPDVSVGRGVDKIEELDWYPVHHLARYILALTFRDHQEEGVGRAVPRGDAIEGLLDITGASRLATADTYETLKGITLNYLHFHQYGKTGWREWTGKGPGDSLHGYYRTALRNKLLDVQTKDTLEGDDASRREWLVFPKRPDSLDYLRDRHTPRAGKPSLESYDGGNIDDPGGAIIWGRKDEHGDDGEPTELAGTPSFGAAKSEELRALEFREIECAEGTSAIVCGESLPEIDDTNLLDSEAVEWMDGGSIPRRFDEEMMIKHDTLRAFEAVYGCPEPIAAACARNWGPLPSHPTPEDAIRGYITTRLGEGASGRTVNMEVGELLSTGIRMKWSAPWPKVPPPPDRNKRRGVVLGSMAARDYAVFRARHFLGYERVDLPNAQARNGWRNIEIDRKGATIRDWLSRQGYRASGTRILPIPLLLRMLSVWGKNRVSGSICDEGGRVILVRNLLWHAINHLRRTPLEILPIPLMLKILGVEGKGRVSGSILDEGGREVFARKVLWDAINHLRRAGIFTTWVHLTAYSGVGGARRVVATQPEDGKFRLGLDCGHETTRSVDGVTGAVCCNIKFWPSDRAADGWPEWRRNLRADSPELPEQYVSDGRWRLTRGVGPVPRKALMELRARPWEGLRGWDYWNDLAPGKGCHWWVVGDRFQRPPGWAQEFSRNGQGEPICCSAHSGKRPRHTVFWRGELQGPPGSGRREFRRPYPNTAAQSCAFGALYDHTHPCHEIDSWEDDGGSIAAPVPPDWEFVYKPHRGMFTGVVLSEPMAPEDYDGEGGGGRGAGRSVLPTSTTTIWITHGSDDMAVGAILRGRPIIETRRIAAGFYEYRTRAYVPKVMAAGTGILPKLRTFLDDEPAVWDERFSRLPQLATPARLQGVWSFRNACHIIRGPVYLMGGGREKCHCQYGHDCLVFRCSQRGRGAVPLHWVAETKQGHCAVCCKTNLEVSSGGVIHGPLDLRSPNFLPGDAAPKWAEVLLLGPDDQLVWQELYRYRQENRDRGEIDYEKYPKKEKKALPDRMSHGIGSRDV